MESKRTNLDSQNENIGFPIPDQRDYQYSYGQAFQLAADELRRLPSPENQCLRSGSLCEGTGTQKTVTLKYLGSLIRVALPEARVMPGEDQEDIPLRDKILILHYLIQAKGTPFSNNLISYKELKEGQVYFPSFYKRAIRPLVEHFGQSPAQLLEAARPLGGTRADYGSFAVQLPAFPRVPLIIVLWKGDEEFPADGNFLFDSTIPDYLSTEDINILCQTVAWKLARQQT
jgi:hypothetical protein